ncbi:DUF421 domain-containing protein [Paenibacillus tepidiphilus]|uniref:DUF421 domain-containing protein n=1 Tax=Paenibacillus tepidiphilus TaxID=2608683 RepID=UPI0012390CCF|nr:DUF421 domain-containing protein [Paenibacillus tepidiphilus]
MDWIWKSVLLVFAGMILLRIAGRKSISQMTIATTVIMISIGTTIVQPIANHELWKAIGSAAVFILFLLLIEYLQLKFDWMERLLNGRAKVLVENGQIQTQNLHSLRMTVDQLEMRLRQTGIARISDLKFVTLEPNGELGYELMAHAQPVTVGDLERLLGAKLSAPPGPDSMFRETAGERHPSPVDPKLQ